MKRKGRDTLTGGTGDINPQYISGNIAQTGVDATTVITVPVPILGLGPLTVGSNNSLVPAVEVLKVYVRFGGLQILANTFTFEDVNFWTNNPSTASIPQGNLAYPQCFAGLSILAKHTSEELVAYLFIY